MSPIGGLIEGDEEDKRRPAVATWRVNLCGVHSLTALHYTCPKMNKKWSGSDKHQMTHQINCSSITLFIRVGQCHLEVRCWF